MKEWQFISINEEDKDLPIVVLESNTVLLASVKQTLSDTASCCKRQPEDKLIQSLSYGVGVSLTLSFTLVDLDDKTDEIKQVTNYSLNEM